MKVCRRITPRGGEGQLQLGHRRRRRGHDGVHLRFDRPQVEAAGSQQPDGGAGRRRGGRTRRLRFRGGLRGGIVFLGLQLNLDMKKMRGKSARERPGPGHQAWPSSDRKGFLFGEGIMLFTL